MVARAEKANPTVQDAAPVETVEDVIVADDRAAKLAAFAQAEASGDEAAVDEVLPDPEDKDAVDAGGSVRAQVTFDKYTFAVGDEFVHARFGDVVKASKADVDRGVSLGGLRKL